VNNTPVTSSEFSAAFCLPESVRTVAVAVSGGPDSIALLLLLQPWARARNITLHAITVDHRLRADSAPECEQVARWCEALGVAHTTLRWQHNGIGSAIMQQARDARYRLMLEWCRAQRIAHLFTAHHQGDQIETFLFRLLRGSGMDGLSAILPVSDRSGIFLHRPLLSFPKSRLLATLVKHGHPHLTDPTNSNPRFTRNALRLTLGHLDETTEARVSCLTAFFMRFRNVLENKINESLDACFTIHAAGYGELCPLLFLQQPPEIQWRMAQHICLLASGDASPIRSPKIMRLAEGLCHLSPGKKILLHGVVFHFIARHKTWLVYREQKKLAVAKNISPAPVLWDGRFSVSVNLHGYVIAALGMHAKKFAGPLVKAGIPKPVWPTLPAIFHLEQCVAIPHIHWTDNAHDTLVAQLQFIPAKLLASERDWVMNQENNNSIGRVRACQI